MSALDRLRTKIFNGAVVVGIIPHTSDPGLGGHCTPIDPSYLTRKAKKYGINTRFIELANGINCYMPHWVLDKVTDALNTQRKAANGSRGLILGQAYKQIRESPAVDIMALLEQRGAQVQYSAHAPYFPRKRDYSFDLESIPLSAAQVADFDCVVLATDHDAFDYQLLLEHARLLVDTRGRLDRRANVVSA